MPAAVVSDIFFGVSLLCYHASVYTFSQQSPRTAKTYASASSTEVSRRDQERLGTVMSTA
jgi:hypothetical protein